jgi:hypothetical protein
MNAAVSKSQYEANLALHQEHDHLYVAALRFARAFEAERVDVHGISDAEYDDSYVYEERLADATGRAAYGVEGAARQVAEARKRVDYLNRLAREEAGS